MLLPRNFAVNAFAALALLSVQPTPARMCCSPPGAAGPAAKAAIDSADEAFLAARDAFRGGDAERFAALAARVDKSHPLVSYVELWQLSLRLRSAEPNTSEQLATDAQVADFFARYPDTWVADRLRMEWLLVLGARRDYETLLREQPKQIWTHDEQQVRCYTALAKYVRLAGRPREEIRKEARDAARLLTTVVKGSEASGEACVALTDALLADDLPYSGFGWERLRTLVEQNQIPTARRLASQWRKSDAAEAVQAIERPATWLSARDRRLSPVQRELAVIALTRLARDNPELAARHALTLERHFSPPQRGIIWGRIGHMGAFKLLPEALDWYRRGGEHIGGESARADEVLEWQVRAALRGTMRGSDWTMVRHTIERMPTDLRQEPAWVYWKARALQAEGRNAEAKEAFRNLSGQFNFYGKLAADEIGEAIVIPPRPTPPTPEEVAAFESNAGFARALKFYELGLRTEGNREWNWQTRGMSDRQLLAIAEFARSRGVFDRMISTSERTREEFDFGQRFPVPAPYREQLSRHVQAVGLDESLVYGLIRQESRFAPDARSSAGALGLMQLMPATARYVARRVSMSDFSTTRIAEPDVNLKLGTTYLRLVLDDLDGHLALASAAYNAGPHRLRTWRATLQRPVEGAIFVETIPFTETRDYVKKVMSNSVYYAALLETKTLRLKERLGVIGPKASGSTDLP